MKSEERMSAVWHQPFSPVILESTVPKDFIDIKGGKTALKKYYQDLGASRYSIFIVLMIFGALLPVKMYLR